MTYGGRSIAAWKKGDFTLLYLWIMFRASGGVACTTILFMFVHGRQALSDNDPLVLVIDFQHGAAP